MIPTLILIAAAALDLTRRARTFAATHDGFGQCRAQSAEDQRANGERDRAVHSFHFQSYTQKDA